MTIDRLRSHWGFTRMPFAKDLAPSMLHAHRSHAEAAARITWCIDERVMRVVTGEVGAGKTVAVRGALAGIDASGHTVIYLGNPTVGLRGLYSSIVSTLGGIPPHRDSLIPQAQDALAAEDMNAAAGSCWSWTKPTSSTRSSSKGSGCSRAQTWTRTHRSPACWSDSRRCAGGSGSVPSPPSINGWRSACNDRDGSGRDGRHVVLHLKIAGRSDTLFSDDALALIHQVSRGLPRAVNNLAVQSLVAAFAESR